MQPEFLPSDVSIKLAIAVGIGLLVGLEREWSQKDLGTRTFAIAALSGTISILSGVAVCVVTFVGLLLVILLTGWKNIGRGEPVESTTSAALIATFVLGTLVGEGHHYTPVATAIVMTLLLAYKPVFSQFAGGLQIREVQSAVLLGLLAFVIYPVLPNRSIDPWQLINPREAWLTVVVIAVLGFVNYVLLKVYSSKGLYYSAVLGGMVNSTATIAELSGYLKAASENVMGLAIEINFLTIVAMFLRNLLILWMLGRPAAASAALPLLVMATAALGLIWQQKRRGASPAGAVRLSSPLSLPKVLKFGAIFLVIGIVGNLGQRYLGRFGFLLVSVVGGFVSSASTAGAAALLVSHGEITPETAGMATVLTSMTSAMSNLPLLHQQIQQWPVARRLALLSAGVVLLGILTMLVAQRWVG